MESNNKSIFCFECATFLDPNNFPFINQNSPVNICQTLHLGQVPTDRICTSQGAMMEEIGYSANIEIPANLKQTILPIWLQACLTEWVQLEEIETWDVEYKGTLHSIVTGLVFDLKRNSSGDIKKLNACFVVQGFKRSLDINQVNIHTHCFVFNLTLAIFIFSEIQLVY